MKSALLLAVFGSLLVLPARADCSLAVKGAAKCVIVRQPGATAAELNAVQELAGTLHAITGATFPVVDASNQPPANAIIVGPGPAADSAFPELKLAVFGGEELVIKTRDNRLLLAGGRPRGTLYAVSEFLQKQCGVRWWTPWATNLPRQATLRIGSLNTRYAPVFEARDPFWYTAFDPHWAVRNFSNSQYAHLTDDLGGAIQYKGFVHTFYQLVPPEEQFAKHPEWFSLVQGRRTGTNAQLCLSNPELRDFVVGRVRQWLRDSPGAGIISVSQNDCHGACECAACQALDSAEGSHAGSMLAFVNYVAEKIQPEFPEVAVDTLAYQYTRHPPRTIRPRANVIVRLCSIECNFREPLDSPANAAFGNDLRDWSRICHRLYVWDYTTDFAHYVQPHPNWFELGDNLRFFADHQVKGVFEEGSYQGYGAEFGELRAWLLAQLLWNPRRDESALIQEFLSGYYGPAAPDIRRYLDLIQARSAGWNLTCYSPPSASFLDYPTLAAAEKIWAGAETAVAGQPEFLPRVQLARLWTHYVWLSQWDRLRKEWAAAGGTWPLDESRAMEAARWLRTAQGRPEFPWTKIAVVNEGGETPEQFVAEISGGK